MIHGHYVTPGSRRVLVIAKECHIPYEFAFQAKGHVRMVEAAKGEDQQGVYGQT
jgi:hypothetical protein